MLQKSISFFLFFIIFFSSIPLWSNTQDDANILIFLLENEETESVDKEKEEDDEVKEEDKGSKQKEDETKEEKDENKDFEKSEIPTNEAPSNETKEESNEYVNSDDSNKEEKLQEDRGVRIVEEKALEVDFSLSHNLEGDEDKSDKTCVLLLMDILKELADANVLFKDKSEKMAMHGYGEKKIENEKEVHVAVAENIEDGNFHSNFAEEQSEEKSEESSYENDNDNSMAFNEEDFIIIDDFDNEENVSEYDMAYNVDDDKFLTFDQEQEAENAKKENVMQNELIKKEELSGRGELSSIVEEDDKVNISRYTNILKGQSIDFSYPGEGWVYLGEETSQRGLDYTKRKMKNGKTFFTFRAEVEGNYVLNFSYFDVFSGDFIVDAVSVKVMPNDDGLQKDTVVLEFDKSKKEKVEGEEQKKEIAEVPMDKDKVGVKVEKTKKPIGEVDREEEKKEDEKPANEIPSTKEFDVKKEEEVQEKKETRIIGKNDENPINSIKKRDEKASKYKEPEVFANVAIIAPENAKPKYSDDDAKLMIDEAQDAISQGDAKVALERLNDFFEVASTNIDKAYLLRGRAYELNGEFKNIKLALKAYRFLTKTFPDSPHRSVAIERIRYIERFFVNIK